MAKDRIKLAKFLPILAPELQESIKALELPDEVQLIRKQIASPEMSIAEGERASVGYISTREADRDNEILDPAGAVIDDYIKNPVVLWAHNYSLPPVGKATDIQVDDYGIRAKTQYAETDRAKEVWELVKGGFLNAHSVGFVPLEYDWNGSKTWKETAGAYSTKWNADVSNASVIYKRWAMLEYSIVPVPANQSALIEAVGKSLNLSDDLISQLGIKEDLIKLNEIQQVSAPELTALERIEGVKHYMRPIDIDVEALIHQVLAKKLGRF